MLPLAIIWKYEGNNSTRRLEEIHSLHGKDFSLIPVTAGDKWMESIQRIPGEAGICLFWIDNDKPVTKNFIQQMLHPILADLDERPVVHFWAGNALAVSTRLLRDSSIRDVLPADSLWRLLPLLFEAAAGAATPGRVNVAFSSTERFAPMDIDPVGVPS